MKSENLVTRLLKDPSKQQELEVFLTTRFGSSSQTEKRKIRHGDQLDVSYSSKGEILDIRWVNSGTSGMISALCAAVEDALYDDHGVSVGETYFFTNIPNKGKFRSVHGFQISPVPPTAPVVLNQMSGDHPAILQFDYPRSTNHHVDSHRRSERSNELLYLLSALVFGGLTWVSSNMQHAWVYKKIEEPEPGVAFSLTSEFRQAGYTSSAQWEDVDDDGYYLLPDIPEIALADWRSYYSAIGIPIGAEFQLPESLEHSLNAYKRLGEQDRLAFLRCAHWLQKANEVFRVSRSLSYSAMMFSIESFLPKPVVASKCGTCEQNVHDKSISASFKDFINEYAGGLTNSQISQFYQLRSSIAHGDKLFPQDAEVVGFRFSASHIEHQELFDLASRVCRVVIVNWLHGKGRAAVVSE